MSGSFIGVDTMSAGGRHTVLGLHEKLMLPPPSFAMRGSTFTAHTATNPVPAEVHRYVCQVLDAVGYDWGAAHLEIMRTTKGPRLVEINARLVGAKMPRLVGHVLGRSMHADLVSLHLGQAPAANLEAPRAAGAIRWFMADRAGELMDMTMPAKTDPHVRCIEWIKQPGDWVQPPFENADRLGYVMTCAEDRLQAEASADRLVAGSSVSIRAATPSVAAEVDEAVVAC
jgi:hypothetical protein